MPARAPPPPVRASASRGPASRPRQPTVPAAPPPEGGGANASFQLFEPPGLNGAVGASLQVGIKTVEVVGHHLAAVEVRHALLRAPFHERLLELVLREPAQGIEQRGPDQPLLLGAVAALAGERAPGAPAFKCRLVHLVAVCGLIRFVVGRLPGCDSGKRNCEAGDPSADFHLRALLQTKGLSPGGPQPLRPSKPRRVYGSEKTVSTPPSWVYLFSSLYPPTAPSRSVSFSRPAA